MNENLNLFLELSKIFEDNGFKLYLVGGTVRNFLLNLPLDDMDAVTDATPSEMKNFIDGDFRFSNMGCVKFTYKNVKFDITTMRYEKKYKDFRHPINVKFVKDLSVDYKRRDFTLNAMYLDSHFRLIDYCNGESDLNSRVIRMVGEPNKRLKEDPLRIIRALRFSIDYDFSISSDLRKAIFKNIRLLENLNVDKINQDLKKIKTKDFNKIEKVFSEFSIQFLLNVIK